MKNGVIRWLLLTAIAPRPPEIRGRNLNNVSARRISPERDRYFPVNYADMNFLCLCLYT
jgi:hypothetical protein